MIPSPLPLSPSRPALRSSPTPPSPSPAPFPSPAPSSQQKEQQQQREQDDTTTTVPMTPSQQQQCPSDTTLFPASASNITAPTSSTSSPSPSKAQPQSLHTDIDLAIDTDIAVDMDVLKTPDTTLTHISSTVTSPDDDNNGPTCSPPISTSVSEPSQQAASTSAPVPAPPAIITIPSSPSPSPSPSILTSDDTVRMPVPIAPPMPPALPPFIGGHGLPMGFSSLTTRKPSADDQLMPYLGPYDGFQRAAARQARWMVVVVCASGSGGLSGMRRRYISNSRPLKMHKDMKTLAKDGGLLLWRRTATSTDLEKYSAFYPIDAYPHIALLDPRTGERMQVWNFDPDTEQEKEDLKRMKAEEEAKKEAEARKEAEEEAKRLNAKEEEEAEKEEESDEKDTSNNEKPDDDNTQSPKLDEKTDEIMAGSPKEDEVNTSSKDDDEDKEMKSEKSKEEDVEEEEEDGPVPVWMTELGHFLDTHSLKDGEVGPMHLGEKPATARTRRVDSSRGSGMNADLQPTSVMDDEEAAIAAAIAASLKDVECVASSDCEVEDADEGDDEDEESDDVIADEGTATDMTQDNDEAAASDNVMTESESASAEGQTDTGMEIDQSVAISTEVDADVAKTTATGDSEQAMDVGMMDNEKIIDTVGERVVDTDENVDVDVAGVDEEREIDDEEDNDNDNESESDESMDSGMATSTSLSSSGLMGSGVASGSNSTGGVGMTKTTTKGPNSSSPILASSIESVSSSYLDRLSSTLRSSTDPSLLESRQLRRIQDQELQASLEHDRAREAKLHALNMAHARRRAAVMNAQARLQQLDNGNVEIVLRFNDGTRDRRGFTTDVKMQALRDVIVVVTQGDCICVGDDDVDVGGDDPVTVARALRVGMGMRGIDLSKATWESRVVDIIQGTRAAFFVQC